MSNCVLYGFITGITSILPQIPDEVGCRGEGAASLHVVSGGKEYLSRSWAFGKGQGLYLQTAPELQKRWCMHDPSGI